MFKSNLWLKVSALLLACFFWLQSVLLKEQQTVVQLPLVVVNQSEQVALRDLPATIKYNVKGTGFDILKLKLFRVTAQLDAAELKAGTNAPENVDYTINLPPSIHLELLGAVTDEDSAIKTESVQTATLPVQIDFENADTRARFYEGNYRLIPDKVDISGTDASLKKVQNIMTQPLTSGYLGKKKIKLKLVPPPSTTLASNTVQIIQSEVKMVTRVMWKIPVQAEPGLEIFPSTITLQVRGKNDAVKSLTPAQISVKLKMKEITEGQIPLEVTLPAGIELMDYTPRKVTKSN